MRTAAAGRSQETKVPADERRWRQFQVFNQEVGADWTGLWSVSRSSLLLGKIVLGSWAKEPHTVPERHVDLG
jgi:hypothetical protein